MLERVKTALVDSFVGAIAIGLLVSQGIAQGVSGIVRFAVNPMTVWLQQRQYSGNYSPGASRALAFESMLPLLLTSVFMLLIAYGLLRWLYFPHVEQPDQEITPEPEQNA